MEKGNGAAESVKGRVLVVDDSPGVLAFTSRLLEEAGYEVETSDQLWISHRIRILEPDLVLVDVNLGVSVTGTVAVTALRRRSLSPKTRYVLYSGAPEHELRRLAAECQADGYLPKDLDPKELLRRIGNFIAGHRST